MGSERTPEYLFCERKGDHLSLENWKGQADAHLWSVLRLQHGVSFVMTWGLDYMKAPCGVLVGILWSKAIEYMHVTNRRE